MGIFSRVKDKVKRIDPFYEEIKTEQIGLYQHYFIKLISSIDIDTQTKWSQSEQYDKEQMAKDEEIMENIIVNEAIRDGLSPALLQVILSQYFFADPYQREIDKENWIKRVTHRKDVDYFPDGWSMRTLLEKVT
jgi:hypothetical protein